MEPPQSPLVVFGPDHIDTSRAEMLVQCLNEKIKEKRFKVQKMAKLNEEKKQRNETMRSETVQLTAKLASIEQENAAREQQLLSEQARIKELQLNIQMLDEHNGSIKRDCTNEEQKYNQEKSTLIDKFERTKQQWIEVFKPQYEQSKVYQYLKQGDTAYNVLVQRKETLLNAQKLASKAYFRRRQEFCNETSLHSSIASIARYYISRRDQLIKMKQMKEKLIELENQEKQLIESKNDKMKAWESVYTQPMKRDLMDFCLQTNIDQALTFSFHQIPQDICSQPTTPQYEQAVLITDEPSNSKSSITFQLPPSIEHIEPEHRTAATPTPVSSIASTITITPDTTHSTVSESNRAVPPSILHLTTAIADDDDELFSTSRRKVPIIQLEQMSINDGPPSTQAFVVSAHADREASTEQSSTQGFTAVSVPAPPVNIRPPESLAIPLAETSVNKPHPNVTTFSLIPNRSVPSAIQPQVTSNDVQQMLLTFSPDPTPNNNEQVQPMEDDADRMEQQEQRAAFSMASSIESTVSIDEGYAGFNYNFGFAGNATSEVPASGRDFTSPINFDNWANLGSPMTAGSNEPFSAFLQQTAHGDNGAEASFSFASFNYGDLGNTETSTDGTFGSFFFANSPNSVDKGQMQDGESK